MSKLLTALLAGAALTFGGTAVLAAEHGDSHRSDNQSGQSAAQTNSNKPSQSGASNTNRNADPTQTQSQTGAAKGQSGNSNPSAYEAEQDVIAKMKCENLSGQQQKDCMAKVKNKAQLDKQHDQSQAGAGGNATQSAGARAGADTGAGGNASQSAGANTGENSSKAGANANANSSQSAGANAGANARQEGPASREQEVIAKMKCNSMSGKQKDDCMGAAKKKAGQM